jgi:glycosyltransferase involved in cell wall biosynthesis
MDTSLQPGCGAVEAGSALQSAHDRVDRPLGAAEIRRRKIFFLLDSFNLGGTETQAVQLATRLDVKRYDVTLGCLRARGPLLEKLAGSGVSVREFFREGGITSLNGMYQVLRLALFLRRGGFSIVHTHDLYANMLGIPAAAIARVPIIISSRRDLGHLAWYQGGRRAWMRRLQGLSAVVLTNAAAIRESLIAEDHFPRDKVRVIHNGVDFERFAQTGGHRDWLLPGTEGEKWIVLVGNMLGDVKGHPYAIAAAPAILREFPKTRFVFVGDGQARQELERQVAQSGLDRHFSFLGRRNDVARILACCDIAMLPSKAEGLPNAILEYMAAGLPTVASQVGGNAELIEEGKTGLLIPPADSSALANALLRILRDTDLAEKLGKSARQYVASHFSFERLVKNTDELYTELLRSRGLE